MFPKQRRQMLARAGIAPPIPSLQRQRTWAWIDDRKEPEGEADGEFSSHIQWVNKATSWIGWTGAKCYDAQGRPCRNGGDMGRARDENAFPVRWYFPDRFDAPYIPTNGEMAAMRFLSGSPSTTIKDLRIIPGAGKMTAERLQKILGADTLIIEDNGSRITVTAKGMEEIHEYQDRARRASYVR